MNIQDVTTINALLADPKTQLILLVLIIWSLVIKGIALWRAAKNDQKVWFIIFLFVNTFGILEIIYIFYLGKTKKS